MSESAQYIWLDALENFPPKCVIIFTTNHAEKLPKRFRDRCERFRFNASALLIRPDVQLRVNDIWFRETGRIDAPDVETLPGVIDNGEISIRAALQALNPLVRSARKAPRVEQTTEPRSASQWTPSLPDPDAITPLPPTPAPIATESAVSACIKPEPVPSAPRKPRKPVAPAPAPVKAETEGKADKWAHVDFQAYANAYRGGAKFMELVRSAGVPQSTMAKRLERIGIKFPTR